PLRPYNRSGRPQDRIVGTQANAGAAMSFRDRAERQRYELEIDGAIAFANYRDAPDGERALTHFETPPELRVQGVAGRLMGEILEEARGSKRKLRARCLYAVDYLEKHPEAADVMT